MIRFGLCCIFKNEKIKFKTATAFYVSKLKDSLNYLSKIILYNTQSLKEALEFCLLHQIGSFRITSRFFPLYDHPTLGYQIDHLQDFEELSKNLAAIKQFAKDKNIRLTLHPDQFVVLNSLKSDVVKKSIKALEYHNILANLTGADVINIHAGGIFNDKKNSLQRLREVINILPIDLKKRLTLENDDRNFTPDDLLSFCYDLKIPFVYDVHHHRVLKDSLSIELATEKALQTWNREPLFHLSSPLNGWMAKNPKMHADYIDVFDFPKCWLEIKTPLTVEIEAKYKELAILKLQQDLKTHS